MNKTDWLATQFEANRPHLHAVAYRMLGSLNEAEDAVQEGWLRLSRADTSDVENLGGWLTTVVGRVCLDMLRSRRTRREEPLDNGIPEQIDGADPEHEAVLADSVGLALLVVLETLAPAERLAFVLHDMFAMPFDEIAPIIGRSTTAARQLASRARRRVQGAPAVPDVERQREVVDAFLAASRGGDFTALVAVLDPDVVLRADSVAMNGEHAKVILGAQAVAQQARMFSQRSAFSRPALVNGEVGIVVAPRGRLLGVLTFTFDQGRITGINVLADPETLHSLELAALA
jgi:RNA polymerase sigma factor (sigma-70 family)